MIYIVFWGDFNYWIGLDEIVVIVKESKGVF